MTATIRICAAAGLLALSSAIASAADTRRGAQLFSDRCAICHSVNGKGGADGPDLGGHGGRDYTPFHLASLMWNHAPKMWEAMAQRNIPRPPLDERDTEDLFAYLYSVRYPEKPGDAARGKQFFNKSCAGCHGLTGAHSAADWRWSGDPVPLTSGLWNHAGEMQAALAGKGLAWPAVTAQNLMDLCAYLRHLSKTNLSRPELMVLDSRVGGALFQDKGCGGCHKDLQSNFHTLSAVAAAIWRDAPKMNPQPIDFGEMRQIVGYVWSRQFFAASGDAARGAQVFEKKGCANCHNGVSPAIRKLPEGGREYSAFTMMQVLWRHGPQMLRRMEAQKISWPLLPDREMADIAAYLSSPMQAR